MARVEPEEQPQGYIVADRESAERILEIEADLLRSEGIDPTWPGFQDEAGPPGASGDE